MNLPEAIEYFASLGCIIGRNGPLFSIRFPAALAEVDRCELTVEQFVALAEVHNRGLPPEDCDGMSLAALINWVRRI